MTDSAPKFNEKLARFVVDLVLVAGVSSVTYGVWLAWQPGAWIVGGASAIAIARGLAIAR